MKKTLFALASLVSLVTASFVAAQDMTPNPPPQNTPIAISPITGEASVMQLAALSTVASFSSLPDQHVTATYSSSPEATVRWSADMVGDQGDHFYTGTITLQNNTDNTFGSWNLAIGWYDTLMSDSTSPVPVGSVPSITHYSDVVSVYLNRPSNGSALGWTMFGGYSTTLNPSLNQDIAPHESLSFSYIAQLTEGQSVMVPPAKIYVTESQLFVLTPDPAQ